MPVITGRIQDEGSGGPGLPADGQVFNVKAYGALGDGVADDTVAIDAAVKAAPASGGIVYFPPGRYLVGAGLGLAEDLLRVEKPIQLLGAGPLLSVLTTNQPVRSLLRLSLKVTDPHDKVRAVMIRDLKFEADVPRDADAAIRQTVEAGSVFQHGIRIENCHFKGHVVGIHLQAASTAVIENCSFWQGLATPGRHQADVWIDEQVGGDSSTHLITGCLFADTTRTASRAVYITGRSGGERIVGNLFVYYREHVVVDAAAETNPILVTAPLVANNIFELIGGDGTCIHFGPAARCVQGVITGNEFRIITPGSRAIHAEPAGTAVARAVSVIGNRMTGPPGSIAIEVAPTGGGDAGGWSIADNLFDGFATAIDLGSGVRDAAVGNNQYLGAVDGLRDQSTGGPGATFLQRVGIGTRNVVSPPKELHLRGGSGVRPRIYLEGSTPTSTPGVEFAFDATNTQRATIVGRAVGSGVQLELYTTPSGGGPIDRRVVVEPEGHLRPSVDNAYTLGTPGARWKDIFAVTKTSSVDVSWGSGRTLMPVLEGAEYQVYDAGTTRLDAAGEALVEIDPRFVEIANTAVPYRVMTSGARVLAKEPKRFRLRGEPGDEVDYTVLAVRAGFENVRWRDPQAPEPEGLADPEHAAARKSAHNNRD